MVKKLLWILLAVACLASSAFAEEVKEEDHQYYLGASLGFASVNYHSNPGLQGFADAQSSTTQTHLPYSFGLVFLFAMPDRQTAAGAGLNLNADAYFPKSAYNYAGIRQGSLVATVRHYFGTEIGHGAFLRGDLGFASVDTTADSLNYYAASPSETGFLWLAGGGYGFGLSKQVSLNLELDYSRVSLSSGSISNLEYKAGILLYL